ncbi:hypothetical protein C8J57DRAFT_1574760 [Mycena rebaudengoi]|nr:hypothetical protein C8J57DRAFT_1574760 [Mycena rebaudengoi]
MSPFGREPSKRHRGWTGVDSLIVDRRTFNSTHEARAAVIPARAWDHSEEFLSRTGEAVVRRASITNACLSEALNLFPSQWQSQILWVDWTMLRSHGTIILVYDHALTLGSEVKLIWQRRLRRPSALWFLAVRYISLPCSCVMFVFHFGNLSPEGCSMMERVLEGLMFLQESLVDTTLGLRVLAMYGFDPRVLVPMLIISAISVALGLWTFIKFGDPGMLTAPALHLTGCNTALPRATSLREARSWEVQPQDNEAGGGFNNNPDDERRRLQGAMYFGIIVLANLANVFTLYFGDLLSHASGSIFSAQALPPTRTEDLDSTELDVIRFKDPRPLQPVEEATVDDQDFELAAERQNTRVEVGLSEKQELNRGQG